MIWVFDSWFWWLQTLKYLKSYIPQEDFIFVADSLHVPYWNKTHDQIKSYATTCINRLCEQWCTTITIACNTAVAWLYEDREFHSQGKHLVGVTYAGVLDAIRSKHTSIWVLCTQATYDLNVYPTIYKTLRWESELHVVPAPLLVDMIETWETDIYKIRKVIKSYLALLPNNIDCLILWCTHYPVYLSHFRELLPQCHIIDPGRSCIKYFDKNVFYPTPSTTTTKRSSGSVSIYCTWDISIFKAWAHQLRTDELNVQYLPLFTSSVAHTFSWPLWSHDTKPISYDRKTCLNT